MDRLLQLYPSTRSHGHACDSHDDHGRQYPWDRIGKENALGMRFAGDALAHLLIRRRRRSLRKLTCAARAKSRAQCLADFGSAGSIIGALCDERAKVDIAPLQISEVNDDLAADGLCCTRDSWTFVIGSPSRSRFSFGTTKILTQSKSYGRILCSTGCSGFSGCGDREGWISFHQQRCLEGI